MPIVVQGSPYMTGTKTELSRMDFSYDYPMRLNLRPGSKTHDKLVDMLRLCANESYRVMQNRFESWNKIDQSLTAYIMADDAEELTQEDDERKPISIVVPYSYATMETALTYLVAAFLQDPIFRYEGVGPEDIIGATLLELIVGLQCNRSKVGLQIHTMLRDSLAYGIGIVTPSWHEQYGLKESMVDVPKFSLFGLNLGTQKERRLEETLIYEGNILDNIDPYRFLPDPSYGIESTQRGEYVGWIETVGYMDLLDRERSGEDLFNVKYLGSLSSRRSSLFGSDESARNIKSGGSPRDQVTETVSKPVDRVHMFKKLIPREYGLPGSAFNPNGEYPEKWYFSMGADQVLIAAKPLGLNHNLYPVCTSAPDFDGRSITPISRLEIVYGLQHTLNFMFNCYDDQTEVLTKRGWINLAETDEDDEVATVDPDTQEFWFEQPSEWFEYDYEDWMLNFKSSRMDICVTPNHQMFVQDRYQGPWRFDTALAVALSANKEPKTIGNVRWPGCKNSYQIDIDQKGKHDKAFSVNSLVMAGFLGWFLSEGSITHGKASGSYAVSVKQSKEKNFEELRSLFGSMGAHVSECLDLNKQAYNWTITHRGFYEWLLENCYEGGTTCEFLKIPDFVGEWDEFHLQVLFDCAMRGDGYYLPTHPHLGKYGTTSKKLVDGLQIVALKLGYFSHVRVDKTPDGLPFYTLQLSKRETSPTISTRNCFKTWYKGKVFCFTNSTHLTITRRNGKVAIQGQSHVANVRKAINDMLIVDPWLINMADLRSPKPGKLIRLRKSAWGRANAAKDAVQQLRVDDITKNNMTDAQQIMDMIERVSASTHNMMGVMRPGSERRSATEFQGTHQGAMNRLERMARVIGLQAIQDIGYMFASHTQQLMSKDTYIRATGDHEKRLLGVFGEKVQQGRLHITPMDLAVDFDVIVRDGSVPGTGGGQAYVQMLQTASTSELLASRVDLFKLFRYVMQQMGAKNVDDFEIRQGQGQPGQLPQMQTSVMPDEQVQKEVQSGNLIPAAA